MILAKCLFVLPVAVVVGLAAAACAGDTATPLGRPTATPPSAPTTTAAERQVTVASDVLYQEDPDGTQHLLRVYAPATEGGPWPVAVMIHGLGGSLNADPSDVAAEGIVVFVLSWTWPSSSWASAGAASARVNAVVEQIACAVRFARAEAERYGGDPSNLSLYGESAGALGASMVASADPGVPEGCVAPSGQVVPDNLVLFEGDWLLLGVPQWDRVLREDPRVMEAVTPWSYLGEAARMPVHILDANDPTIISRTAEDADDWLALRDPTGKFLRDLEELGAFDDDGVLHMREAQRLLYGRLQSLGYQVAFHDLPDSTHNHFSKAAEQVVVDAILRRT